MKKTAIVRAFTGAFLAMMIFVAAPSTLKASVFTDASIKVENHSDWDIYHLFMSPADKAAWGPDQMGDFVLKSGGNFTLKKVPCDVYDIKVVDEDGDACVIADVSLCEDKTLWQIDNDELLSCEGFGN